MKFPFHTEYVWVPRSHYILMRCCENCVCVWLSYQSTSELISRPKEVWEPIITTSIIDLAALHSVWQRQLILKITGSAERRWMREDVRSRRSRMMKIFSVSEPQLTPIKESISHRNHHLYQPKPVRVTDFWNRRYFEECWEQNWDKNPRHFSK